METDDLITWGLMGVGAYLLYNALFGTATVAAAASAAPVTTSSVPVDSAGAGVAATPAQQTLALLQAIGPQPVIAAAQKGGDLTSANTTLTTPQWNWYLDQVSGVNADDTQQPNGSPLLSAYLPAGNAAAPVSVQTWWAALIAWAQAGVAYQATAQANAQAQPVTEASSSALGDLGYRDASAHFAEPPAAGHARFDFEETAW